MPVAIGGNLNTNTDATTTTYTINSVTATVISTAKTPTTRLSFRVDLDPSSTDVDVFIRLYPASDDVLTRGIILTRSTLGNTNVTNLFYEMPPTDKYIGEISAITGGGSIDIHVTEY